MTAQAFTFERIDWYSPTQMARVLLRRHRDLSTVRAMIRNEFGRSPSVDILKAMQAKEDQIVSNNNRRFTNAYHSQAVGFSLDAHHLAMERGSKRLASAIKFARGSM